MDASIYDISQTVLQGAHASGYGFEDLVMVSEEKKIQIWGNKVTEGQKKILAQKMNKRANLTEENSDCMFFAFLWHSVLKQNS